MSKEVYIPAYPCMFKPDEICVNCKQLATNIDDLRKRLRDPYVKYVFNHGGIDNPKIEHLIGVLFDFQAKFPMVYSDVFNRGIEMSPELKALGAQIAIDRSYLIIDKYKSGKKLIGCPVYKDFLTRQNFI